ncbi:hypothetical protein G9A89_000452 [Geosiphon pyriformis]|nr:hypothetical protein G9A89_000452 [Geosiphon pyriformis]
MPVISSIPRPYWLQLVYGLDILGVLYHGPHTFESLGSISGGIDGLGGFPSGSLNMSSHWMDWVSSGLQDVYMVWYPIVAVHRMDYSVVDGSWGLEVPVGVCCPWGPIEYPTPPHKEDTPHNGPCDIWYELVGGLPLWIGFDRAYCDATLLQY